MAKRGGFPGGMPGNMNNLMKQAQRMQRQMEEAQKELEEKEVTAAAGGGGGGGSGLPGLLCPDHHLPQPEGLSAVTGAVRGKSTLCGTPLLSPSADFVPAGGGDLLRCAGAAGAGP